MKTPIQGTRYVSGAILLMIIVIAAWHSCKPITKDEPIVTPENDTVFNVAENKLLPATPGANIYRVMRMEKTVLEKYTGNPNFESFYFVYQNENAQKPRSTVLVCYALDINGDWLEKDGNGLPIEIPLTKDGRQRDREFPGSKKATLGSIHVGATAVAELKKTLTMATFKYLRITPSQNSPLSFSLDLINDVGDVVSGSCSPQPCPPAKPGARGCVF
jgi:hypothetical protein